MSREIFTPLHHEIADLLGYKQTPGYASWDKVEQTAPVQVVDRLVQFVQEARIDELRHILSDKVIARNGKVAPPLTDGQKKFKARIEERIRQIREAKE